MAKKLDSGVLHPGPGFQVRHNVDRPRASVVEQFKEFSTADISDLMNRLYAVSPDIQNLSNGEPIAGPACTVKVYSGDNLMVHAALDIARPGDIIVVDGGGATTNAVLGDLVCMKAGHRGIAGFIVDGMIRDLPGIQETGMPVYARGETPVGPLHRGPGEINQPVCCGGVVVNPGDIIRADNSGIIVIRKKFAPEILRRAYLQRENLTSYVEAVRKGDFSNDWANAALANLNCGIDDD